MDTNPTAPTTSPESATQSIPNQPIATITNPVIVSAPPPKKKIGLSKKWILISLVLLGIVVVAGAGGYFFLNKSKTTETVAMATPTPDSNPQVACTLDAKECPDGSFVSRQGLECEFAKCPAETANSSADISDWKTYTSTTLNFNYPSNYKTEERVDNFFVISPNNTEAALAGISIDARKTDSYKLVLDTQLKNLINVKQSSYKDGVKIYGEIGPGEGQGMKVTSIVLPYKNTAIVIETTDPNVGTDLFDQFVSTIKFN